MRKYYFCLLLILVFPVFVCAKSKTIDYKYLEYKELINSETKNLVVKNAGDEPMIGITSHHLPVASSLISEFYLNLQKARPKIKNFIIIGPDHFEHCKANFSTTKLDIDTGFGKIINNQILTDEIIVVGAKEDNNCFNNEHAIGVEANYIKKYFPDAEITPILLSFSSINRDFSKLKKLLITKKDVFIIGSMDFSHYLKKEFADTIDKDSEKKIKKLNAKAFKLKNVDSPGTIKLLLELARELKLKPKIITHKNSFDFTARKTNTTSYFNVLFLK